MVFSSPLFLLIFFPAFFLVYYLSPRPWKNSVAVAASLFFYAWGAPKIVGWLILLCFIDYTLSLLIARYHDLGDKRWPRIYVGISVVANVSLLAYFKYANFFVHEVNRLIQSFGGHEVAWTAVALPIGVSFFTFHKISYVVDIYRGTSRPTTSFADFLLYILLFPQLIAGPIIRFHDIATQLRGRQHTFEDFFQGMFRFALGLGKKVLIANTMGQVADTIFGSPVNSLPTGLAWLGAVAYSFQIYFDFSGYSDMAIGLARMMGFHFLENFNMPYIARSITDFWRRWHISLSNFMREYLYIPLGGNRVSPLRMYFNLWIVFLISGIWHGANWTFILWGAYHGFFLAFDKLFWLKCVKRLPPLLAIAITHLLVIFGWVLFRATDGAHALRYAGRMLNLTVPTPANTPLIWQEIVNNRTMATFILAAAISFLPAIELLRNHSGRAVRALPQPLLEGLQFACLMIVTALSLIILSNSTFNPFIYFRF